MKTFLEQTMSECMSGHWVSARAWDFAHWDLGSRRGLACGGKRTRPSHGWCHAYCGHRVSLASSALEDLWATDACSEGAAVSGYV